MAKYNWKSLEKEYLLGDYKSVSAFLKDKNIPNNGTIRKYTSGWKDKKRQKDDDIKTKTIEKVIEKQSEKSANEVVNINGVADMLLKKIQEATEQLNINVDVFGNQHNGIVDRNDLKKLTSALKDIKDITRDETKSNDIEDLTVLADLLGFGDKERKQ